MLRAERGQAPLVLGSRVQLVAVSPAARSACKAAASEGRQPCVRFHGRH